MKRRSERPVKALELQKALYMISDHVNLYDQSGSMERECLRRKSFTVHPGALPAVVLALNSLSSQSRLDEKRWCLSI